MSARQNFGRWVYLMQHIHTARYHIAKAEEIGHPHMMASYEGLFDFLAQFRAALNAYAKCFVTSGVGRTSLKAENVFDGHEDYLIFHNKLIDLRHKYVAHCDENEFEKIIVIEKETEDELVLVLDYGIFFPFDRMYQLRDAIKLVELFIIRKQQMHIDAIKREVGKPVRVQEGGAEGS